MSQAGDDLAGTEDLLVTLEVGAVGVVHVRRVVDRRADPPRHPLELLRHEQDPVRGAGVLVDVGSACLRGLSQALQHGRELVLPRGGAAERPSGERHGAHDVLAPAGGIGRRHEMRSFHEQARPRL